MTLKILFFLRNVGYIRNFDAALGTVFDRRHSVEFMVEIEKTSLNEVPAIERLNEIVASRSGAVRLELPKLSKPLNAELEEMLAVRDYLRYLDPEFRQSPDLRDRARWRIRSDWLKMIKKAEARPAYRRRLDARLKLLEQGAPPHPGVTEWLASRAPDLLCVTPLVALGSVQSEFLRAARHLGIPSAFCVASWDNLTNKGLVHGDPDGTVVWNAAQKDEAIRLHGLPGDSVHVVGAHTYDHWFDWQPKAMRPEFLAKIGLPPEAPLLLYLCSSPFIAPDEIDFIEEWLDAVRGASDPELAGASVLIRPHPQNQQDWARLDRFMDGRLQVFPRAGQNPVGSEGRETYFASLKAADVVVGINTSGMIEAGILEKPVMTVRHPRHDSRQEGTAHFQHLLDVEGGLLTQAADLAAHVADLSAAFADPARGVEKTRRFICSFVRPQGLDKAAAPLFADALEHIAAAGPRSLGLRLPQRLVWRLAQPSLRRLARRSKENGDMS